MALANNWLAQCIESKLTDTLNDDYIWPPILLTTPPLRKPLEKIVGSLGQLVLQPSFGTVSYTGDDGNAGQTVSVPAIFYVSAERYTSIDHVRTLA